MGQMTKSIHETISDSILIVFSKINLLNLVNIFRQLVIYFIIFLYAIVKLFENKS